MLRHPRVSTAFWPGPRIESDRGDRSRRRRSARRTSRSGNRRRHHCAGGERNATRRSSDGFGDQGRLEGPHRGFAQTVVEAGLDQCRVEVDVILTTRLQFDSRVRARRGAASNWPTASRIALWSSLSSKSIPCSTLVHRVGRSLRLGLFGFRAHSRGSSRKRLAIRFN